jgi:hypothetical protein
MDVGEHGFKAGGISDANLVALAANQRAFYGLS